MRGVKPSFQVNDHSSKTLLAVLLHDVSYDMIPYSKDIDRGTREVVAALRMEGRSSRTQ